MSDRLGEHTIEVESRGNNWSVTHQKPHLMTTHNSGSTSHTCGGNVNVSEQGRKLLKAEEILALSPRTAITFCPGRYPIRTTLIRYYEEPNLGWRRGGWLKTLGLSVMLLLESALFAVGITAAMAQGPLFPPMESPPYQKLPVKSPAYQKAQPQQRR